MSIYVDTLTKWQNTTFEWGVFDCLIAIGGYLDKRDGSDFTSNYALSYSDEQGAQEVIDKVGGGSLHDTLVVITGIERLRCSKEGSVSMFTLNSNEHVGLSDGKGFTYVISQSGLSYINDRFLQNISFWDVIKCHS